MAKRPDRSEHFMTLALKLAARGRGRVSPNPMVGAVVVKRGVVVGQGYHRQVGGPHAEVHALLEAGAKARGADLYVNLEPCAHHGRTPPCTEAIITAGIKKVVIGTIDPNPLVNGQGVERLRAAGIAVVTGVREQACLALNEAFCFSVVHERPLVTLKSAITLDGRVATRAGHSRWVSGPEARRQGHRLRHENDAILVGLGTVQKDDPALTCREVRGRDPLRVVIDSGLNTPLDAQVVRLCQPGASSAGTVVVTTKAAPKGAARELERLGVGVLRVATRASRVDMRAALRALTAQGVRSLLVEGGPTVAGALWKAQLVDKVVTFIAPKLLADAEALPMLRGAPAERMTQAVELEDVRMRRMGADFMVQGAVRWPSRSAPQSKRGA